MKYMNSKDSFDALPTDQQQKVLRLSKSEIGVFPNGIGYSTIALGSLATLSNTYHALKESAIGLFVQNSQIAQGYYEAAVQDGRGAVGGMAWALGGLMFVGVGKYFAQTLANYRASEVPIIDTEQPVNDEVFPILVGDKLVDPRH